MGKYGRFESVGRKLKIEKMVAGGYGLARENGKIYLVKGAYTGEDVNVSIEKVDHDLALCKVERVNVPISERQNPVCEHFGKCGGCEWMDVNYKSQLRYKKEIFTDQMKHIAKIDIDEPNIISTKPYGYRNKAEFVIEKGKIGYYGKQSHDFVEVKKCPIIEDALNDVKDGLKDYDLRGFDHLVIREGNGKKMAIFISKSERKVPDADVDELIMLVNERRVVIAGRQIVKKGNGYLDVNINGMKYIVPAKAFFQVSYEGAEILSSKVKTYAGKGRKLLDLYCGVGFFTLKLAENFVDLDGIESSPSSVKAAQKNAAINGISNVHFFTSRAENFKPEDHDVIMADPPRTGLDKAVRESIIKSKPDKFVYVSCDVTTFARDSNELIQKGYKIEDVTLVDLFPQTHHFEIVSSFGRA